MAVEVVRRYPAGGGLCPRCHAVAHADDMARYCTACGWELRYPAPDQRVLESLGRQLLVALGEDPEREGLRETPARWARWWAEFIAYRDQRTDTTFETAQVDQVVVVRSIPVFSLCEHHLLPFRCEVTVGYIPQRKVLGLSKFARIAVRAGSRLQLQERLVEDIAREVGETAVTPDVAVWATGQHLCMQMRGIRSAGEMVTSVMHGAFRDKPETRAEFLGLVQ